MEAPSNMGRKSKTPEGMSSEWGLRRGGWRGRGGLLDLGNWRGARDEWGARRSGSLVSLGMTIYVGRDGLGRGRLGGLWGVTPTGLRCRPGQVPTGQ